MHAVFYEDIIKILLWRYNKNNVQHFAVYVHLIMKIHQNVWNTEVFFVLLSLSLLSLALSLSLLSQLIPSNPSSVPASLSLRWNGGNIPSLNAPPAKEKMFAEYLCIWNFIYFNLFIQKSRYHVVTFSFTHSLSLSRSHARTHAHARS